MSLKKNFKLINRKDGLKSENLYSFTDKCLYIKSGVLKNVIYYKCTGKSENNENCLVRGKLMNDFFYKTNRNQTHNHASHEIKAEVQENYNKMKNDVKSSTQSIESLIASNLDK